MRRCLRKVNAALTIITNVQEKKNAGGRGEKFPTKEAVLMHVQKEHKDTKCPMCFRLFISEAQLNDHMQTHLNNEWLYYKEMCYHEIEKKYV